MARQYIRLAPPVKGLELLQQLAKSSSQWPKKGFNLQNLWKRVMEKQREDPFKRLVENSHFYYGLLAWFKGHRLDLLCFYEQHLISKLHAFIYILDFFSLWSNLSTRLSTGSLSANMDHPYFSMLLNHIPNWTKNHLSPSTCRMDPLLVYTFPLQLQFWHFLLLYYPPHSYY